MRACENYKGYKMDIGSSYINRITELYTVEPEIRASMLEHIQVIDRQLGKWSWEDIEDAIDLFYTKKNDKKFPKVAQIRAILNTNKKDKALFSARGERNDDGWYNLPSTRIKVISDVFLSVCRYAHKNGILNIPYFSVVENIQYGNDNYIKYDSPDDKDGRVWHKKWDWDDAVLTAKERFPDTFKRFYALTKPEEYCLTCKLGLITIGEQNA